MKKILCFIFVALLFCLGANFCQASSAVCADQPIKVTMRVYGDSMTAGYGLSDYDANNPSYLPAKSFPNIINEKFSKCVSSSIQNYAISGDTSSDLVEILEDYTNGTADDMADFVSTDHFIVCIGANNILGPATANIINYIISSIDNSAIKTALATYVSGYQEITEAQYRAILAQGVQSFKTDFENTILPTFKKATNAQIHIMTVYNPFKHTSLNNINAGSLQSFVPYLEAGFQEMLSITMEYLNGTDSITGINEIIRDSAGQNVNVVDIWDLFETFSNQQYKLYINSDETKITISTPADLNKSTFTSACDPHPTANGHEVIALEYLPDFYYFESEFENTSFSPKTQNETYEGTLSYFSYGEGDETFKLFAKTGSNTYLTNITPNLTNISISASTLYDLIGQKTSGTFYIQYTGKNSKISNSQEIAFDLTNYDIQATLSSLTNFGDITKITDVINFKVEVEGNLTYTKYELCLDNEGTNTIVGTFVLNTFSITAKDIPKVGKLYVKVYSGSQLVATSNVIEYSYSLPTTATLSAPNGMNISTLDDSIMLNVEMSEQGNYTYKLYKNSFTLIGEYTTNQIIIKGTDIASIKYASGYLGVEVYNQNKELVARSNFIEYDLTFSYTVSLACTSDFSIAHKADDLLHFVINTNYSTNLTYRLYNKLESGYCLITETTSTNISIYASDLMNGATANPLSGEIYVDVYEDNYLILGTNKIDYTLLYEYIDPEISITSNSEQITSPDDIVSFNVSVAYNHNFRVEVFVGEDQLIHSEQLTSTSQTITLKAGLLGSSGAVYVRVYHAGGLEKSESISYSFEFGNTQTATLTLTYPNGEVTSYDSLIVLNVSISDNGTYEYKYIINSDYPVANNNITTASATYQTTAASLRKSGSVYCEVYQNNTLVCTTNTVEYNFEFLKEYVVQISIANQQSVTDPNSLVYIQISMQIPNDNYTFKFYRTDLALVEGDEFVASTESIGIWVAASILGKSGTLSCEIYKGNLWLSQDSESLCEYNFANLNIPTDDDNNDNNNTGSDSNSGNGEQNPNNTSNDETAKTIILIAFFAVIAIGGIVAFVVVFRTFKKRL